jgi:hypothetical protein
MQNGPTGDHSAHAMPCRETTVLMPARLRSPCQVSPGRLWCPAMGRFYGSCFMLRVIGHPPSGESWYSPVARIPERLKLKCQR